MNPTDIGKLGEDHAVAWLEQKGYRIAARNYRAGRGEIDIVAWEHDELLVFVEVKTRADMRYGGPAEAITRKKQEMIARTAGAYMRETGYEWAIRFDSILVLMQHGVVFDIQHVEDAFFQV